MKLCWDNIENIKLSKKGVLRDIVKGTKYIIKESCKNCGYSFFAQPQSKGECCCISCGLSYNRKGKKHPLYGKKRSEESKQKISGSKNTNWKGGYYTRGIPTYDTYAHQISWCEGVRRNKDDINILEVKCFKCGEWFIPKYKSVVNRISSLSGKLRGEHHLYCSDQCKNSCSIYSKTPKTLMKDDAIRSGRLSWIELTREVQPELRQIVLERDRHKCTKCDDTENLQCHHIYPEMIEPLLSADIDNCITLCVECHKEAHRKDGCNYNQLHMEEC